MKEVKAFIHAHRASGVIRALKGAEEKGVTIHNLAVFPVKALLHDPAAEESRFSLELGDTVVNEVKIEVLCPDESASPLVALIKKIAHTTDHEEGWVVVTDVVAAESIGIREPDK